MSSSNTSNTSCYSSKVNELSYLLNNKQSTTTTTSSLYNIQTNSNRIYSRYQSFAGLCLCVSLAGITYSYGILSQLLRKELYYNQSSIDFIASFGNTGLYLSFFIGLCIEYFGYHKVIQFGGLCICIGFLYLYLAISKVIISNVICIAMFYFISQIGVCCHIASAIAIVIQNYPKVYIYIIDI